MSGRKYIYLFGDGKAEGDARMRDLLGGKGAGLAEMTNARLPVPPGFTITTEACNEYYDKEKTFPEGMWEQAVEALKEVERIMGKGFGDSSNPLLVSVRSGAKFSMPGMMDTVLNLGLNEETLQGLISQTGDKRFAYDAYRRFISMFGRIVLGIHAEKFDRILDEFKKKTGAKLDTDLTTDTLKEIVHAYKEVVKKETGSEFPSDSYEQLKKAFEAVFGSWMGKRAVDYRNFNKIPHNLGTAINVQTMVFGNMGENSGTGVAFTRNPATGEKKIYGEYLLNAQGEDVVAGIRTPQKIEMLQKELPEVYSQFLDIADMLERHYKDVQDLEFTVEKGRLWMLQTRGGKRTARAAVKIAVDMVKEGLISREDAILRVDPNQVYQLLLPRFDQEDKDRAAREGKFLAKGLNASPGAATGKAIFDPDTAEIMGKSKEPVILVRMETSPDDVHGMLHAKGILTSRGGATSHAAVVARGLGLPCVAGCEAVRISEEEKQFVADNKVIKEGDFISIDGTTGEVFEGIINTIAPNFSEERDLIILLGWADEIKKLGVWANADYPKDASRSREFGAEGIGLCRTEHMFFEQERLPIVQRMILAKTEEERDAALDELLPIQKEDFKGIFRVMDGLPVVIRLIDPPLHEFLPSYEELLVEVAQLRTAAKIAESEGLKKVLKEKEELLHAVEGMREMNPMLGLRGCRLGLLFPSIIKMQVRAILEAACELRKEGIGVQPEIMIPLTGHINELKVTKDYVDEVDKEVRAKYKLKKIDYKYGTMIEIPRAALTADEIAQYAEFFSFGTNDLTQTTFGFSRDDAEGKFLLQYIDKKILPENPFQTLDQKGVGKLMEIGVTLGRKTRRNIKLGICGEHGGDPESVEFCHKLGLTYVSCSPFRVPIARLAAAQAKIKEERAVTKDI